MKYRLDSRRQGEDKGEIKVKDDVGKVNIKEGAKWSWEEMEQLSCLGRFYREDHQGSQLLSQKPLWNSGS